MRRYIYNHRPSLVQPLLSCMSPVLLISRFAGKASGLSGMPVRQEKAANLSVIPLALSGSRLRTFHPRAWEARTCGLMGLQDLGVQAFGVWGC